MMKLVWAMIIGGIGLIAYPFFVKPPKYDPRFNEAAIDALEYPNQVRVLVLQPAGNKKELQAYWPGVSVYREYSTPKGWASNLEPMLKQAVKPGMLANAKGQPDYVIRYEGRATTLDLVLDKDSGTLWFQERGALKPFFAKVVANPGELLATLRPVSGSQPH